MKILLFIYIYAYILEWVISETWEELKLISLQKYSYYFPIHAYRWKYHISLEQMLSSSRCFNGWEVHILSLQSFKNISQRKWTHPRIWIFFTWKCCCLIIPGTILMRNDSYMTCKYVFQFLCPTLTYTNIYRLVHMKFSDHSGGIFALGKKIQLPKYTGSRA